MSRNYDSTASPPRVALIIDTSLASGRDVLRGIGDYVRQHGPWSIVHEPRGLEDPAPKWLQRLNCNGIIARVQNKQIACAVTQSGLPVVDVLGLVPEAGLPLVHVDDKAVARLAAEHLFERGFRHFAYFGIKNVPWSQKRHDAFQAAIKDAGYKCDAFCFSAATDWSRNWEKKESRLARWLLKLPKPVGIMACNDPRGRFLLEVCRRMEIRVPETAAVVGVDNDEPFCMIADPPLSSVVPNHGSVGFEAAALLAKMMSGEVPPKEPIFIMPQGIVTRASSDVSAIEDPEVASLVRYVRDNACKGIDMHDVVRFSGLSRSTLSRKTHKVLGRSLYDEIMRVRLNLVCELLSETNLSIEDITNKSGFNHRQYLGKVFKAKFGETLVEYRKRFQ